MVSRKMDSSCVYLIESIPSMYVYFCDTTMRHCNSLYHGSTEAAALHRDYPTNTPFRASSSNLLHHSQCASLAACAPRFTLLAALKCVLKVGEKGRRGIAEE